MPLNTPSEPQRRQVIAEYPEEWPDGSVWYITEWNDGTFSKELMSQPTQEGELPYLPDNLMPRLRSADIIAPIFADRDTQAFMDRLREKAPEYFSSSGFQTVYPEQVWPGNIINPFYIDPWVAYQDLIDRKGRLF